MRLESTPPRRLIWATRGRAWGFRFLLDGGLRDPLPEFERVFATMPDTEALCSRTDGAVAVRFPDPLGNPYLTFVALLMAGLDGIENKIHPGEPLDKNLYDLPPREQKRVPEVCGSLREALDNLNKDRAFLTKGGVMDDDFIDSYIELKMEEVMRLQLHPHPVEFDMYFAG